MTGELSLDLDPSGGRRRRSYLSCEKSLDLDLYLASVSCKSSSELSLDLEPSGGRRLTWSSCDRERSRS